MTALLDVRSVSFAYPGGPPVLVDATVAIAPGSVLGILGPNGAGKSTLARLAAGILQPTTGTIHVAGAPMAGATGRDRARKVRVSFQIPEHELFRRDLGAELDWEARLLGVDAPEMRRRIEEMLAACGAAVPLDTHPYDLDPWQRKLFACVSALGVDGRLVILDEPTLRLGPAIRTRLGAELRRYATRGGAVALVTHDHEFASVVCDRAAVVRDGRIASAGPVSDVLASDEAVASTTIYSFPSFFLDRALRQVRRRDQFVFPK